MDNMKHKIEHQNIFLMDNIQFLNYIFYIFYLLIKFQNCCLFDFYNIQHILQHFQYHHLHNLLFFHHHNINHRYMINNYYQNHFHPFHMLNNCYDKEIKFIFHYINLYNIYFQAFRHNLWKKHLENKFHLYKYHNSFLGYHY